MRAAFACSDGRVLMQVGQVARVGLIAVALLLGDCDDRAGVLAALGRDRHLTLGLLLEQHLDRIVGVDTAELGVVAQHF